MSFLIYGAIVLFFVLFPFASQFARDKIKGLSFINPLIAAYVVGILLGNTLLRGGEYFSLLDGIATAAVLLSIPLMLFTLDLRNIGRSAGKAVMGIVLAAVSIVITVGISYYIFGDKISDFPGVAGLLVAVYTGGTPNLAAIRTASGISNDLYLAVHAGDVLISAVYFLFMITVAKRVFSRVLPQPALDPESVPQLPGAPHASSASSDGTASFPLISEVFMSIRKRRLLAVVGIALVIVGISVGISLLVPPDAMTAMVILSITSLSLVASFNPWVRHTGGSFELGEYAILIFALAAGAMGDFSKIVSASPIIFAQVAFAIFLSMIFHLLLCRLFKIDVDTMMVSSTAAICSPPFVGVVATTIGNKKIIAPGIAAGLIGYAIGNYLGIGVIQLFRMFS